MSVFSPGVTWDFGSSSSIFIVFKITPASSSIVSFLKLYTYFLLRLDYSGFIFYNQFSMNVKLFWYLILWDYISTTLMQFWFLQPPPLNNSDLAWMWHSRSGVLFFCFSQRFLLIERFGLNLIPYTKASIRMSTLLGLID